MSRLIFLVPGIGGWSLQQEECCWQHQSSATPSLALHAIAYLRRTLNLDRVYPCRPLDSTIGTRAMIFSWIFGEQIEDAARQCSVLIANPSSAADAIRERFPAATVIPARDVFDDALPLNFSPLDDWPHTFDRVLYQTTSGCRWRCPYCVWDHELKRRPPELAAAEILALLDRYPVARAGDVLVLCNEITGCGDWLSRFCGRLKTGTSWRADANVRNAVEADFVLARKHGLAEVTLGIEALDDELLRKLNKGHTVADAFRVFRWLQDLGIRYRFALRQRVGETPEQLERQIDALRQMQGLGLRPSWITIGPMDHWPGARWQTVLQHGSRTYPRGVKSWGDDADAIIERWGQIAEAVAALTGQK